MIKGKFLADGREIIAVEDATVRHPHPSRNGALVPTKFVQRLLLSDDSELFACNTPVEPHCPYVSIRAQSVVSHQPSHNPSASEPDYPRPTIEKLLRIAKRERGKSERGYGVRTADELNRLGIPTLDGKGWDNNRVVRLYDHWHSRIKVNAARRDAKTIAATRVSDEMIRDVVGKKVPGNLATALETMTAAVAEMNAAIARLGEAITLIAQIDLIDSDKINELKQKAADWDSVQALLNRDRS